VDYLFVKSFESFMKTKCNPGSEHHPFASRASDKRGKIYFLLVFSFLVAIPAFGDVSNIYFQNAFNEYERGEFGDALADYNKAIELNPRFAEAYNNRGNLKQDEGDTEDAFADYQRAIKLKPDFGVAYYNRGYSACR
jgi:tetratricopeptide (TPR) repeat protein